METVSKDVVNGYECTCVVGFTGTNCETNINDCEGNPCINGTCVVSQYKHTHMHAHYCGVIQFFRMVLLHTSAHVQLGGQVGTARQTSITVLPTPVKMEEPAP